MGVPEQGVRGREVGVPEEGGGWEEGRKGGRWGSLKREWGGGP